MGYRNILPRRIGTVQPLGRILGRIVIGCGTLCRNRVQCRARRYHQRSLRFLARAYRYRTRMHILQAQCKVVLLRSRRRGVHRIRTGGYGCILRSRGTCHTDSSVLCRHMDVHAAYVQAAHVTPEEFSLINHT